MKNLITLIALSLALGATAQDTTITRRISFDLAIGLRFDTVFVFNLPKPKPDTIYVDRIVLVDSSKGNPKPKPVLATLNRSAFPSLQSWLDSAVKSGATALLDRNDTIKAQLYIRGNIKLDGGGNRLHNAVNGTLAKDQFAVSIDSGVHYFANLNISQVPTGRFFFTVPRTGATFENYFDRVNVTSGYTAYESSRGGTASRWAITAWKNSLLQVGTVAISIFSQDGPWKALHLDSVAIYNGPDYGDITIQGRPAGHLSHTLYAHPNVSLRFDSVSLFAGNLGLHHFSGGGVPGINEYTIFRRVLARGNKQAAAGGGMIEIRPGKDTTIIDQSDFALYSATVPLVKATNSTFSNRGSGSFMAGTLINCRGVVMPSASAGPVYIFGGLITELDFRLGGTAIVEGATIYNVWAGPRQGTYNLVLRNSKVENIVGDGTKGAITSDQATTVKRSNVSVAKKEISNRP